MSYQLKLLIFQVPLKIQLLHCRICYFFITLITVAVAVVLVAIIVSFVLVEVVSVELGNAFADNYSFDFKPC